MSKISGFSVGIEKTPTIGSSTTYAAGDQIGLAQTLTVGSQIGTVKDIAILQSLYVVEKGKASMGEFDIVFFDTNPTLASVDNEAVSMTSSNMLDQVVGRVNCPAAYWKSMASGQVYALNGIGAAFKTDTTGTLYAVPVARGTLTAPPTGDGLKFVYVFSRDNQAE